MKLFYDPKSTASRIVTFFLYDQAIAFDPHPISLTAGEQRSSAYTVLNPSQEVPLLEDGELLLAQSSVILRYLSEKHDLPTYPANLAERAKVDEWVAWFQTNFFMFHCGFLSYTYIAPIFGDMSEEGLEQMRAIGRNGSARYLSVLEAQLQHRAFVCGDSITIADYVGAANVTLGGAAGVDFKPYPSIRVWLLRLSSRPGWETAYAPVSGLINALGLSSAEGAPRAKSSMTEA